MARQDICWLKKHSVNYWIDEVKRDIEQDILTENLVNCLREMLDYIEQLEKAYFKLKKEVEELEEKVMELEEVDSDGMGNNERRR